MELLIRWLYPDSPQLIQTHYNCKFRTTSCAVHVRHCTPAHRTHFWLVVCPLDRSPSSFWLVVCIRAGSPNIFCWSFVRCTTINPDSLADSLATQNHYMYGICFCSGARMSMWNFPYLTPAKYGKFHIGGWCRTAARPQPAPVPTRSTG